MEIKLRWYERIAASFEALYLCCRYGIKGADKILKDEFNEVKKENERLKELKEKCQPKSKKTKRRMKNEMGQFIKNAGASFNGTHYNRRCLSGVQKAVD